MSTNQAIQTPVTNSRGKALEPRQKLKLQKAVREFEAVFVGQMLKSMRNTITKADNSNEGFGTDLLAGMFDLELAKHVSKSSNLGLATMLYKSMTGEELQTSGISAAAARKSVEKFSSVATTAKTQQRTNPAIDGSRPQPLAFLLPRSAVRDAVEVAKAKVPVSSTNVPKSLAERLNKYKEFIAEASEKHGVSENLLKAVIAAESHGKVNARSHKNAKGLMQLIDSTAAEMGVRNVWDPRQNIQGGAKYLAQLLEQFGGDERLALAGYNAGPANVIKHGGVPPFRETKQYVNRVMSFVRLFEQQENRDE